MYNRAAPAELGGSLAQHPSPGGTFPCRYARTADAPALLWPGSLSFSGDTGDWVTGGQSFAYSTAAQDTLGVSASTDNGGVSVNVNGANGDWWTLDLAAPSGTTLAPGSYTGATRAGSNGPTEPGLSLSGNGKGCSDLTGSFTVQDVVFGPRGYVQKLDATYEQHCSGSEPALRGEVHISNPPAPAELQLGVDVAAKGTVAGADGRPTVHGTVTCNVPTDVSVAGEVTQTSRNVTVTGPYSTSVACAPGAPVAWTATVTATGDSPFVKGDAQVRAQAFTQDPNYGGTVSAEKTATVTLTKS
ncbi:hypothetical protein AB0H77_33635 [Streptomyces sp. NPDC050844]|uniref:hypothetical protein n=1 Tax=Streptomyces sp. NPDC050844 TaxID=3155790 RepID=UPI003402FFEB